MPLPSRVGCKLEAVDALQQRQRRETDCVECHLPPKGSFAYFKAKGQDRYEGRMVVPHQEEGGYRLGQQGRIEYATKIVYNESCKECHINLFPEGITDDGVTAHLYEENEEKLDLQCISCHLDADTTIELPARPDGGPANGYGRRSRGYTEATPSP